MEQRKEQLTYETELLRLAWVTAVAIGGGNASLMVGTMTPVRAGLLLLGFLLTLVFVAIGVRQDRTIRRLLREFGA